MKLGFVITNDKASYVAKEDSIHLFCVAKETALNEQQIKSCVLLLFCLFQQRYTIFVLGKLSGGEGEGGDNPNPNTFEDFVWSNLIIKTFFSLNFFSQKKCLVDV